jgi:hypothetical protein
MSYNQAYNFKVGGSALVPLQATKILTPRKSKQRCKLALGNLGLDRMRVSVVLVLHNDPWNHPLIYFI